MTKYVFTSFQFAYPPRPADSDELVVSAQVYQSDDADDVTKRLCANAPADAHGAIKKFVTDSWISLYSAGIEEFASNTLYITAIIR